MKPWVRYGIFVLCLGVAIALVFWVTSCTAPVNVNVKAENWQCPAEVHNQDGTVDFKGCQKIDGNHPTDQDATDGEDKLEISRLGFWPSLN